MWAGAGVATPAPAGPQTKSAGENGTFDSADRRQLPIPWAPLLLPANVLYPKQHSGFSSLLRSKRYNVQKPQLSL